MGRLTTGGRLMQYYALSAMLKDQGLPRISSTAASCDGRGPTQKYYDEGNFQSEADQDLGVLTS
jgi:hypothetical protein